MTFLLTCFKVLDLTTPVCAAFAAAVQCMFSEHVSRQTEELEGTIGQTWCVYGQNVGSDHGGFKLHPITPTHILSKSLIQIVVI